MKKRKKIFRKVVSIGVAMSILALTSVSVHAEEKINLAAGATFSASTTWGDEDWVAPDKLNDGDLTTRWASADEDREIFVEIDFGKDTVVDQVYQVQGVDINGPVITTYTISYWNGTEWKEVVTDGSFDETEDQESNGKYADDKFESVTTSKLRIDYQAEWGITLYEIEVYGSQQTSDEGSDNTGDVNEPEEPTNPSEPEDEEPPKTGDASVLISLIAVSVAALGGRKLKKH